MCRRKGCFNKIPSTVRIDGKRRNLQNRSFCLSCSPFGGHNTKPDDPTRPSLDRSKRYQMLSSDNRLRYLRVMKERGRRRKQKLIDMSGGGCTICGYNECQRGLAFYHLEQKGNNFRLSVNNLWSTPWKRILEEYHKCKLLCVRCMAEEMDNEKSRSINS